MSPINVSVSSFFKNLLTKWLLFIETCKEKEIISKKRKKRKLVAFGTEISNNIPLAGKFSEMRVSSQGGCVTFNLNSNRNKKSNQMYCFSIEYQLQLDLRKKTFTSFLFAFVLYGHVVYHKLLDIFNIINQIVTWLSYAT